MEDNGNRNFSYYMRALHRDIDFFMVGLIFVYAISGITLVYRDTNFLKKETRVETKLSPDIEPCKNPVHGLTVIFGVLILFYNT